MPAGPTAVLQRSLTIFRIEGPQEPALLAKDHLVLQQVRARTAEIPVRAGRSGQFIRGGLKKTSDCPGIAIGLRVDLSTCLHRGRHFVTVAGADIE